MKIIPSTGADWFALALLPFKIFVPGGWLMLTIKREIIGYRMDTGTELVMVVFFGYFISFLALTIGALIQSETGPRGAYLSTCAFIIALFVFGFLSLQYLAHT
jgi:hypothetical protein